MLPYSTLRDLFRIPWVRDNRAAVNYLNTMFYLLVSLYRSRRIQEYLIVRDMYFNMFESFAIYGRSQARDVLGELLAIPWFKQHQGDVYRLLAIFKQLCAMLNEAEGSNDDMALQFEINKKVREFITVFKVLSNFNHRDEERITELMGRPDVMDVLVIDLLAEQHKPVSHTSIDTNIDTHI